MYTCWMALLKWELAEVALAEDVLRGKQAAGRAGRESELQREAAGSAAQMLSSSPILAYTLVFLYSLHYFAETSYFFCCLYFKQNISSLKPFFPSWLL